MDQLLSSVLMAEPKLNVRPTPPMAKILGSPSTVFIGDLPKDVTQVELYEYLKEHVEGDFELVLKR